MLIMGEEFKDDALLDAARLLIDHCANTQRCEECIFFTTEYDEMCCRLYEETPCNWELETD